MTIGMIVALTLTLLGLAVLPILYGYTSTYCTQLRKELEATTSNLALPMKIVAYGSIPLIYVAGELPILLWGVDMLASLGAMMIIMFGSDLAFVGKLLILAAYIVVCWGGMMSGFEQRDKVEKQLERKHSLKIGVH